MTRDFNAMGFEAPNSTLANTYLPGVGLAQAIVLLFLNLYGGLNLFSTTLGSELFYGSLLVAIASIPVLGYKMVRTRNPSVLTLRLDSGEDGRVRLSYATRHDLIVKRVTKYPSTPLVQPMSRGALVKGTNSSMTVSFYHSGFHLELGFPSLEEMQSFSTVLSPS